MGEGGFIEGIITSRRNARVRQVRALQHSSRHRGKDGLMVAEGLRLLQELARSGLPVEEVFYTADFAADPAGRALLKALVGPARSLWEVSSEVMAAISDTQTPQGVLAVLPTPDFSGRDRGFTLIVDEVRDPGNLGTMLRTAWAAGCGHVLLPPGTVDPTNPKVVRAGMGAHFFLPVQRISWDEIRDVLADADVWLAEVTAGVPYDRVAWHKPVALVVGSEAEGAGSEARSLAAGHYVHIPMATGVESLNAAVAAGILLFAIARQIM